jgi:hypothetical protein
MTRAILTERLRAFDRLWWWVGVTVGPTVLRFALVGPSLLPLVVEQRFGQPEGSGKWLALILPLAITGVATLLLVLVLWSQRWTALRYGLLCPSCGRALTGRYRQEALSSGSCGHCHAQVVEDG